VSPAGAGPGRLIAIGASTGGTEAVKQLLARLPADSPGIVIVQHMPESFTKAFAARLDRQGAIRVSEARAGEAVEPGHAYVAPGHSHLLVRRSARGYDIELSRAAPVNRCRPSVDVTFFAVAAAAGANAIGVLLTGMGKDGAAGLLALRRAGACTLAQDQSSCVVFGMPKEAIALGAAQVVVPLGEMGWRVAAAAAR